MDVGVKRNILIFGNVTHDLYLVVDGVDAVDHKARNRPHMRYIHRNISQ